MKHFVKIIALLVAASAVWLGLLKSSIVSGSIWLLPVYFVISLGCYGLLMVGVGLMVFPTCPHEAVLLQKAIWLFGSAIIFNSLRGTKACQNILPVKYAKNFDSDGQDITEAVEFLKGKGVDAIVKIFEKYPMRLNVTST